MARTLGSIDDLAHAAAVAGDAAAALDGGLHAGDDRRRCCATGAPTEFDRGVYATGRIASRLGAGRPGRRPVRGDGAVASHCVGGAALACRIAPEDRVRGHRSRASSTPTRARRPSHDDPSATTTSSRALGHPVHDASSGRCATARRCSRRSSSAGCSMTAAPRRRVAASGCERCAARLDPGPGVGMSVDQVAARAARRRLRSRRQSRRSCDVLEVIRDAGLPEPVQQYPVEVGRRSLRARLRVAGPQGLRRVLRPAVPLAARAAVADDSERLTALVGGGWLPLVFTDALDGSRDRRTHVGGDRRCVETRSASA